MIIRAEEVTSDYEKMENIAYNHDDNQEYDYIIDLLSSNKEASEMFLEVCKKASDVDLVSKYSDKVSKEIVKTLEHIESNSGKLHELVDKLSETLDYIRKTNPQIIASTGAVHGCNLNLDKKIEDIESQISILNCDKTRDVE